MNHLYLLFVLTFYQLFNAPQIDFGLCQYCNNKIIIFIKCKILSIETILSSYMHVQHTHTYTCIRTHTHTHPKSALSKSGKQTDCGMSVCFWLCVSSGACAGRATAWISALWLVGKSERSWPHAFVHRMVSWWCWLDCLQYDWLLKILFLCSLYPHKKVFLNERIMDSIWRTSQYFVTKLGMMCYHELECCVKRLDCCVQVRVNIWNLNVHNDSV